MDGPLVLKRVEEVFVRQGVVFHLHVGGQVIRTTPEHPFYVRDKGWTAAGELEIGDLIAMEAAGGWVAVQDVLDTGQVETVYNFRVANYHTYFVGSTHWGFSVWVHNTYTNKAMRDAVNVLDENGYRWYRDPFTNQMKRTRQRLVPDHIFAADRIEKLTGFSGGELICQIGTGYFGCRTEDGGFDMQKFLRVVQSTPIRAIEIKLSQGAKPGRGG